MSLPPTMPALQFDFHWAKLALAKLRGLVSVSGYWSPGGPVSLKQVPFPKLVGEDWVLIQTVYCGICGSDLKELTLHGARDNPLQTLIGFPHIMGHEVVGVVARTGARVSRLRPGDRVAVSPWFSCGPRGMEPPCPRCQEGDYPHCRNFRRGRLPAGMHLGVTPGFGGFAPFVAVHESQCFVIPPEVGFAAAVLADPFSVAFHSCLLLAPKAETVVLVFGLGVIGLATLLLLKRVFGVQRLVAVGRYPFQRNLAMQLGAEQVFMTQGDTLIEEVAAWTRAELYRPDRGWPWTMDGVDGIIDTIASAGTLAAGLRCLRVQGRLVFSGVEIPQRCENTPHYFKELELLGSNAFGRETFQGRSAHAFEFFFSFLAEKKFDPSAWVTHRFPLSRYRDAFAALAGKAESQAVKVVFDFTTTGGSTS